MRFKLLFILKKSDIMRFKLLSLQLRVWHSGIKQINVIYNWEFKSIWNLPNVGDEISCNLHN